MLRTPSTGLLTSNVSWEDVEKVVDAKYHGAAAFGPKKRISPLGLGIGLQSLLGVVDPDWKTNGKITLPSNFALKIASPVVMLQVMMSEAAKLPPELTAQMSSVVDEFVSFLTPCHNSEMFFYEFFENCAKRCEIVPRYHFGTKLTEDNQSRAFLAVEMIENAKSGTIVQSLTDVQMEQVLKSLARMQAAFVDAPDDVIQKAPHQGLSGVYNTIKDFILVLNNRASSSLLPPELASLTRKL
ncbi:unnamed protein product [Caenorhabditis auriculariae]|uniref:Uncharacterized protein n=1 Tax=Caenorhabditis auriculariae TaxID=2777116 RepID=A0A8S1HJP4_9PELO|nr:unnamed protein product [Caenorhabditis auriculariae]